MSDKRLPFGPVSGQEVRAYEPSWRDVIASWFMGDQPASPEKERLVSGMFGSTGLGPTGPGVVDFTPFGLPLAVDEYKRAQTPTDAAFAAMGLIPGAKGAVQGAKAVADDAAKGIRAYHGSPHDFDRFSLDKIGTGEGAQAYGHGLYFAQNEGVAKSYRDALSVADPTDIESRLAKRLDGMAKEWNVDVDDLPSIIDVGAERNAVIRELQNERPDAAKGHMYEVRINADPESFLDWNKPHSQQSEAVRQAAEQVPAYQQARESYKAQFGDDDMYGWHLMGEQRGMAPEVSQQLREAGVPGIKYLDQGSRGAGEGSRNYVVFDDELVEILRKYGIALPFGLGAAGAGALSQGEPETY